MKESHLFIDESGVADPKALSMNSGLYILCGCSIAHDKRQELKVRADQIKFKYWGHTNVVFHSRAIAKNRDEFVIFAGKPDFKKEFLKDLFHLLHGAPVTIMVVVVDKKTAAAKRWWKHKLYKETSRSILFHFVAMLLSTNIRGKIFVESSDEKDQSYLNDFSYFSSPGSTEFGVDEYKRIKELLTCISFVTKRNHDIEEQLADLFAYGAKVKFEKDIRGKSFAMDSYESRIINKLEMKLFTPPSSSSKKKRSFYNRIEAFCVLPK